MLFTLWGHSSTLFLSVAPDGQGLAWAEPAVLLTVPPPRAIAYGQIVGETAGSTQTLVYAAAPPKSPYPRDFVSRQVTFVV
jgi:hypothetical protein